MANCAWPVNEMLQTAEILPSWLTGLGCSVIPPMLVGCSVIPPMLAGSSAHSKICIGTKEIFCVLHVLNLNGYFEKTHHVVIFSALLFQTKHISKPLTTCKYVLEQFFAVTSSIVYCSSCEKVE